MKRLSLTVTAVAMTAVAAIAQQELAFDPEAYTLGEVVMPDGHTVRYRAYEGIPYVTNPTDPQLQRLNFYVPLNKVNDQRMPILLRTYVGGYMGAAPSAPAPDDATGRALREGMAVCIPGSRGWNTVTDGVHTGVAPAGILDLKAAVRYLHYNDALMPGNAGRIVTDGWSAGGAMSSLLGATGNSSAYASMLTEMGAADAPDDVYAAVCYCPITDLEHADMEYEWLYGVTNTGIRALDAAQCAVSDELAAMCPAYINSLHLVDEDGNFVTSVNYRDYLKSFLIASAERALQEGCPIASNIGVELYRQRQIIPGHPEYVNPPLAMVTPVLSPSLPGPPLQPIPGVLPPPQGPMLVMTPPTIVYTDYVSDIDLDKYLEYVASVTPLKTPPAFDKWGVLGQEPSVENYLFGDNSGAPANFTDYSLRKHTGNPSATVSAAMADRVSLMNPMDFIDDGSSTTCRYWYIRHGALDRDTSFLVPVNLATKLRNAGCDVDFALPWNRTHQGDYNLDDLFHWIKSVTR